MWRASGWTKRAFIKQVRFPQILFRASFQNPMEKSHCSFVEGTSSFLQGRPTKIRHHCTTLFPQDFVSAHLACDGLIVCVRGPVYPVVAVLQRVGDHIHLCPQRFGSLRYDTCDLLHLRQLHLKPLVHVTILWNRERDTILVVPWHFLRFFFRLWVHWFWYFLTVWGFVPQPAMHWWFLVCPDVHTQVSRRIESTSWRLQSWLWYDGLLSAGSSCPEAPSSLGIRNVTVR